MYIRLGVALTCFWLFSYFLGAYLAIKTGPKIDASGPNLLEIEFPLIWTYGIDFRADFEGLRPPYLEP